MLKSTVNRFLRIKADATIPYCLNCQCSIFSGTSKLQNVIDIFEINSIKDGRKAKFCGKEFSVNCSCGVGNQILFDDANCPFHNEGIANSVCVHYGSKFTASIFNLFSDVITRLFNKMCLAHDFCIFFKCVPIVLRFWPS